MRKLAVLILAVLAFACRDTKREVLESSTSLNEKSKPNIKLYAFNGGTVIVNNLELFSQDATHRGQSKEFANPFYVISHPNGNLMWEGGLPERLVTMSEPYTVPNGNFTIFRKDSVVDQLKTIGLSPDDFKYIALSNTHFDHSGHANVFSNATWLVQNSEYDFVTREMARTNSMDVYMAIKGLRNVEKLNGDFDVFGDGSVVLKSLPGFTPGHQALFLDLPEYGPLLLSGDLYHLYENREYRRMPSFNFDPELTKESMEVFEAFASERNAKVYVQHEKKDFDRMPKAPNYLN